MIVVVIGHCKKGVYSILATTIRLSEWNQMIETKKNIYLNKYFEFIISAMWFIIKTLQNMYSLNINWNKNIFLIKCYWHFDSMTRYIRYVLLFSTYTRDDCNHKPYPKRPVFKNLGIENRNIFFCLRPKELKPIGTYTLPIFWCRDIFGSKFL